MRLHPLSRFPFVSLSDCGEIVTGSTPPKANAEFWDGSIPFVTPTQLGFLQPITSAEDYVTNEGAKRGRLLPPGAVLVCCIGSLGKTGVAGIPLLSNQQINAIIFDQSRVDSRYGYYAARSLTPLLEHFAPATTLKIVKKSAFAKIQIPLPPLAEQKRIAGILDAADALRAKRRAALAQLDALAQSLFLDLFGDPVTNPKGWEVVQLGNHTLKIGSGSTPKGGDESYKAEGIALIRSLNVRDGEFKWKDLARIDDIQAKKLANVIVDEDDVLLNITGASVARVCRASKNVLPARVNQHVCIIRSDGSVDQIFLERLLLADSMKRKLLGIGGAGATREAITKAQVVALEIPLPPLPLQQQFAAAVEAIEKQKARHREHLAGLDALFASLQHRAFRGEL